VSVLIISGLFSGQKGVIAQVARIFGSLADMGESAAAFTSTAVEMGNVITSSMSLLAISVANSSKTVVSELWCGVDLLNVTFVVKHGKVAADDGSTIAVWLNSSAGQRLVPVDQRAQQFLCDTAQSVGIAMPLLHMHDAQLQVSLGVFTEIEAESRMLESGHIVMMFTFRHVLFKPYWANPVWEWFEFDVQAQHEAIAEALVQQLDTMPYMRHNWSDLTSAEQATAPLPQVFGAKLRRLLRLAFLSAMSVWDLSFIPMGWLLLIKCIPIVVVLFIVFKSASGNGQ
jgi:hypothetical protein